MMQRAGAMPVPAVWAQVLLSVTAFAFGLGLAGIVSGWARQSGWDVVAVRATAALTTLLVVGVLLAALRYGLDRRVVGLLAAARPGHALTGAAIVGGSAVIVFGAAAVMGAVTITAIDGLVFVRFLVINILTALALEALPEELVFRGYVYGTLRRRWRPLWSGLVTTGLFLAAPGWSSVIEWALGHVIGRAVESPSWAPGGQDPVSYLVLLGVFGAMLIVLRQATGSVWAPIGAHLVFLTVNRALLSPQQYDAGLTVDVVPGAELLVPAYLAGALLAGLALSRARHTRARHLCPTN